MTPRCGGTILPPMSEITIERNVLIPMRDGARLAANLFRSPGQGAEGRKPAVLSFYPYHKDGLIGAQCHGCFKQLAANGYHALLVDLRGTGQSDGVSVDSLDPLVPGDLHDTVEWVAAQPWCDGNVGVWGISYGGLTSLAAGAARPPHLRAIVPIMGVTDSYTNLAFPGGRTNMSGMFGAWMGMMQSMSLLPPIRSEDAGRGERLWRERLEAHVPYLVAATEHRLIDDYWRQAFVAVESIEVPTYVFAGWRDIFPRDCFDQFARLGGPKKLTVGPWLHTLPHVATREPIDFEGELTRWFDRWLKGVENGIDREPAVSFFLQGDREGWHASPSWPPPASITEVKHAAPGGTLGDLAPGASWDDRTVHAGDPTVGVHAGLWSPLPMLLDYPQDQRRDDQRSVTFTSAPLAEPLAICGSPVVEVHLETRDPDPTLVAKLCDVSPDGTSALVTTGWLRVTHRDGHDREVPVPTDTPLVVAIPLWVTAYRLAAGHRLRLSIATADFPRIWPNAASEPVTIRHGGEHVTSIRLPVTPEAALTPRDGFAAPDLMHHLEFGIPALVPRWEIVEDLVRQRVSVRAGLELDFATAGDVRIHMIERHEASVATDPRDARPELRVDVTLILTEPGREVTARASGKFTLDQLALSSKVESGGETRFEKSWKIPWKA